MSTTGSGQKPLPVVYYDGKNSWEKGGRNGKMYNF